MYAEMASMFYWILVLGCWAIIICSVYKLVESLNFKLFLPLIAGSLFVLWLTIDLGHYAEELHRTDRSFPIFSGMLWTFLGLLPFFAIAHLWTSSAKPSKEEFDKAVSDAVAVQLTQAGVTLPKEAAEQKPLTLAQAFAADPVPALQAMQEATGIELDEEQQQLAISTGREVVDQGEPTIAKLAERWSDVIELVQFAGRVRKHLVTA